MSMKVFKSIRFHKDTSMLLALTTLGLIFHSAIEKTIDNYIVNPLLSNVQSDLFSDSIIICLLLAIVYDFYMKNRRNYYVTTKTLTISIIVIAIYSYYRITCDIWNLTGFSFVNSIKYLDIPVTYFFIDILLKINYKSTPIVTEKNKGFYLDKSLDSSNPDLLNRENLAITITQDIKNTNTPDSSFAIGISSEWGYGKTSFIYLLEKHINNSSHIVIKFNPWLNHDSKNILKDFFNTLRNELSKYNSSISPVIKRYADILTGIENSYFKNISNTVLNLFSQKETIHTEFKKINSAIEKLDKKLIIFIDDLDRLYKEEIIEIVKLIRNSANFGNTFFIVAYDKNYIINALKDANIYNSEFFIEKIFQFEIHLPKFEENIIKERIIKHLIPRLTDSDKKELNSILDYKNNQFEKFTFNYSSLTTLRDVTRFSNSFLLAYGYLKGEIVLSDLLNLELLRLKYPGVYKLIFFNQEEFIDTATDNHRKTCYILRSENSNDPNSNKSGITLIEKYLEDNHNKAGIPSSDIDKAISILQSLFPNPKNTFYVRDMELLSINNPISFERYSHYRLLDSNLSEIEFSNFRQKSIDEFCVKINEWVNKGLRSELKRRFENINNYADKEDFEKIISAIFYLARIPKNESLENDYSGFDYDNLFKKLSEIGDYRRLKYYATVEEYKNFIINIFKNAPSPYSFDIELIYYILEINSIRNSFIASNEELLQIRLKYLENYLAEASVFDSNVWHLYNYSFDFNAVSNGGQSYQIHSSRNKDATNLIIDFAKTKALDDFLFNLVQKSSFPFDTVPKYAITDLIVKMFGSFKEFETFLKSFNVSKYKYLKEFLEFYNIFEEKNFEKYVEFDFKDIPVN